MFATHIVGTNTYHYSTVQNSISFYQKMLVLAIQTKRQGCIIHGKQLESIKNALVP